MVSYTTHPIIPSPKLPHNLVAVPFENSALEMIVEAGASTKTVPVLIVQSLSDDDAAIAVTAGGSTVIVCVLMQGVEVEAASPTTAAAVVSTTATFPAALDVATAAVVVAAALTTVLEMIEPVTVTVTGTLFYFSMCSRKWAGRLT